MTTLTAEQHTALLAAIYALAQKEIDARERGDLATAHDIGEQWNVLRILVDNATIEASDTTPLWRDSDRKDWMKDCGIRLELVAAPYITVGMSRGWSVLIDDADETVAVSPEHLPALIATLQEVQRRIEVEAAL